MATRKHNKDRIPQVRLIPEININKINLYMVSFIPVAGLQFNFSRLYENNFQFLIKNTVGYVENNELTGAYVYGSSVSRGDVGGSKTPTHYRLGINKKSNLVFYYSTFPDFILSPKKILLFTIPLMKSDTYESFFQIPSFSSDICMDNIIISDIGGSPIESENIYSECITAAFEKDIKKA